LNVEEVNTDIYEPIDAPLPSYLNKKALSQRPKWEKRLPRQLSTSTLDAHGTSIILSIEISTTDTSEIHSIKMLLDSRAMGSFIKKDFVHTKDISTQSISCPILVYNVDSSPNKTGQISEVIDVVLHYKTHSERTLLAVSSLEKQSMILKYTWLKDHNTEVNWQTGEVQMNQCPPQCKGCHVIQKEQVSQKKIEARAINICQFRPPPEYVEDSEEDKTHLQICKIEYKQEDRLFVTRIHPEYAIENLHATSTISQKLVEGARHIMNIKWDYNYYQPWSDNEWLVNEILVILDEDIIMQ